MKFRLLLAIAAIGFLFSCSSTEDEEVIPPENVFNLEEKIIGKWDVVSSVQEHQSSTKQHSGTCKVFSFVFNADGSFLINHNTGTTTGKFVVEGENIINLGAAGSLTDISFLLQKMNFSIELKDLCSMTVSAKSDEAYIPGSCYSFLGCHHNSFWISQGTQDVVFLNFKNNPSAEFFVRNSFTTSSNCRETVGNIAEDTNYQLLGNQIRELSFSLEEESVTTYTYKIQENGEILEKIESGGENTTRTFEPAAEEDMSAYQDYPVCKEKTFVPDNIFEATLIQLGYDDAMDDYVLTENLLTVTDLSFGNWELTDLTGIEACINLINLYIQPKQLTSIDLTKNKKLKKLFLHSQELEEIDLTRNLELESLYIEYAAITSLDLSANTNLRAVELQILPLTFLNISANPKLEMLTIEGGTFKDLIAIDTPVLWHLNLSSNEITAIEVHYFPNLKELDLAGNNIEEIDLSGLKHLEFMDMSDNKLNAIEVSSSPGLRELFLQHNDLEQLDVSANLELQHLNASENLQLTCIQIAEVHQSRLQSENGPGGWAKDATAEFSLNCD